MPSTKTSQELKRGDILKEGRVIDIGPCTMACWKNCTVVVTESRVIPGLEQQWHDHPKAVWELWN